MFKIFLLSCLACSQIWLNSPMDHCYFGYFTNLTQNKKNWLSCACSPVHRSHKLGKRKPVVLPSNIVFLLFTRPDKREWTVKSRERRKRFVQTERLEDMCPPVMRLLMGQWTWWVLSLNAYVTIVLRVLLRVHTRSVFSAPLLLSCCSRLLLLLLLFSFVARCAPPACLVVFSFIYRYPKLEIVVGELCSSRD